MVILHKKNTAYRLAFPMVSTANPETFLTGETVSAVGRYSDDAGSWTTLTGIGTITEIGTTGVYDLSLTAANLNHTDVWLKFTSTNAQDTLVSFHLTDVSFDDLVRATTPANTLDVNATGEAGADLVSVSGNTNGVAEFSEGIKALISGTAQTGTLTVNAMTTSLTGYSSDTLIGRTGTFNAGTADGQQFIVGDYDTTNGLITFETAVAVVPANNDAFVLS